jgi:hypothetical protein
MSQTRAARNTARQTLGFVMHLAGFDATSPDEMPASVVEPERRTEPEPAAPKPTPEQGARLRELIAQAGERDPSRDWKAVVVEVVGVPFDRWTPAVCAMAIESLEKVLAGAEGKEAA